MLCEWFRTNSMQVNVSKFLAFLLSTVSVNAKLDLTLSGAPIENVTAIDILGVTFDSKLNFNEHVNKMCVRASRQVSALQRLANVLDFPSRKMIYQTFILANFNYCPIVWFFTSKASIDKIKKIQQRALRFVLKDYTSEYDILLRKAEVVSIRVMTIKYIAIEIYKILNDKSPVYLKEIVQKKDIPYSLRDPDKLVQPRVNSTAYGIKSLRYYGAKLWNSMPIYIKEACSLQEFKLLIKQWSGPECQCAICNMIQ